MKIAIDVREANGKKTGKGFFAFGLTRELLALDKENTYILYTDENGSPFVKDDNVHIKKIPLEGFQWHWQVLQDLKVEKPDIYLSPTSYIIPALASRWLKVYLVVHDLVAFLYPQGHSKKAVLIERMTLRWALRKAKKVLVVSENTQNDLMKIFKYPKTSTMEVACAPHRLYQEELDIRKSAKITKKYKLPEKFILGVGTLEPRKNFSNLIKSFVTVKKKFPEFKLVIVGKKGWKYNDIMRTVREFNLDQDVIFTGYVPDEDLHYIYNLAEVFVFPSLYEGFGIPPLEAMASGCPVVASNTSSLPEVIDDAGLLVDPNNSLKIADAIISILEDPHLKDMLLERGLKRASKFSWKESAQLVLDAFAAEKT